MVYLNTQDPNDVTIDKEIDILAIIPENQNDLINPVSLLTEKNNVLLIQKALIGEGVTTDEAYLWLTWFDEFGNRIGTVDRLSYEGIDYRYISGYEFYEGALYLLAYTNELSDAGIYHFYKVLPDEEPQLLSEIKISKPELDYIIGIANIEFTEDLDVIMPLKIRYGIENKSFPNLRSSVSYYCKFDGFDLGLKTSSLEEQSTSSSIEFFPNPVENILNFRNANLGYVDNIRIYNLSGSEVLSFYGDRKEIDVSFLKPGLYKAMIMIDDKFHYGSFIKI